MMRWLVGLVIAAAVLWAGWWLAGSTLVLRGATAGIEDLRAEGWDIVYDDLSVAGFPSRFDVTVDAPDVTSPDGGFGFAAPFLQVFALSYRVNHIIAVAPHEMTVRLPQGALMVTSEDLRASVVGSGLTDPVLVRATLAGRTVEAALGDLGATVDAVQLATRQAGGETLHDVALDLSGITPSPALRALLDPGAVLPATVGTLSLDAQVTLTDAIGANRQPRVTAVTVRNAALAWGDVRLDVDGELTVAGDGLSEGVLTLRAEGWASALRLAVGLGLVEEARVPLLTAGMTGMADGDGAISLDLVLRGGQMSLGGIPLGPVPGL